MSKSYLRQLQELTKYIKKLEKRIGKIEKKLENQRIINPLRIYE